MARLTTKFYLVASLLLLLTLLCSLSLALVSPFKEIPIGLRVRMGGDVDFDGDIDYDDFILLAGSYGSGCGEPPYIPYADFDNDCDVDYDDFIPLAGNYGKKYV